MPRATRLIAAVTAGTLALMGCESLRGPGRGDRDAQLAPTGALEARTPERLVAYLNDQADAINALQYNRVAMQTTINGDTNNLGATKLACEKPRNFALVGSKGIIDEIVVLGSNDQEFWAYMRLPQKSYVYCSHADLPSVASKLPVPFDPDWAMQALGMYSYPAGLDYRVESVQRDREHLLSYPQTTPGGRTVRVTVAFAADPQKGDSPQVRRMTVEDAQSAQVVATATIKAVSRAGTVPRGGVPTEVELDWPQQKAKLALDLGEPVVNPAFDAGQRQYFFSRREMGIEAVNLTKVRFRGTARAQSPAQEPPPARRFGAGRLFGR